MHYAAPRREADRYVGFTRRRRMRVASAEVCGVVRIGRGRVQDLRFATRRPVPGAKMRLSGKKVRKD